MLGVAPVILVTPLALSPSQTTRSISMTSPVWQHDRSFMLIKGMMGCSSCCSSCCSVLAGTLPDHSGRPNWHERRRPCWLPRSSDAQLHGLHGLDGCWPCWQLWSPWQLRHLRPTPPCRRLRCRRLRCRRCLRRCWLNVCVVCVVRHWLGRCCRLCRRRRRLRRCWLNGGTP